MATVITMAGGILEAKRTPFSNGTGAASGVALEIADVTNIRRLENEVVEVVKDVEVGRFGKQITAIDGYGFTSFVGESLNKQMAAISTFIAGLERSVAAMASGDLTQPLEGSFVGDYAQAQRASNNSLAQLHGALTTVSATAADVRAQADTVAQGAAQAGAQTETLQQTSETMQTMAGSIRDNAGLATQLLGKIERTSAIADAGGAPTAASTEIFQSLATFQADGQADRTPRRLSA